MERQEIFHEIFRALAIAMLIAVFIAALAAINHPSDTSESIDSPSVSTLDNLSTELRRCSTLGPQDAEDTRCEAVWGENRRRFFGRPAQPVPPMAAPADTTILNQLADRPKATSPASGEAR